MPLIAPSVINPASDLTKARSQMGISLTGASVRSLIAAGISIAGPAFAAPAIAIVNDADQLCINNNFKPTYALVQRAAHIRGELQGELERAAPDWPTLRRLFVKMQTNDMLFRREMHRMELMCLDKINVEDRISSLRFEFRKIEPPPITVQKSR